MTCNVKTYKLGTAVKFTIMISVATATTATITIESPGDVVVIDDASMTKDADYVYSYIWQSSEYPTGIEGEYDVITKVTYSGYTGVSQETFIMERAG